MPSLNLDQTSHSVKNASIEPSMASSTCESDAVGGGRVSNESGGSNDSVSFALRNRGDGSFSGSGTPDAVRRPSSPLHSPRSSVSRRDSKCFLA